MSEYTIIDALEDPRLLRPLFKDLGTWRAWIAFLKAAFGIPLEEAELQTFRRCTGRQAPPAGAFAEVYAIVGRRGGKSFMSAVIACYLALFHDWRQYLAPGETAWVMVIATDREQARNILNYIKGILASSKLLRDEVESDLSWEINLRNQVGIKIGTCSYRALRGYTVVAAICDELAYWRSEGANPAQEVLNALRPSLATIPGGMIVGISSPYGKSGPLYDAFREGWGQADPDVLIWKAPTQTMNPTIKSAVIDRAIRADYASARAEWMAEFREDLETFLLTDVIEGAIISDRRELPVVAGANYQAFCDPSGGRSDAFTLAIAHRNATSGKIILDKVAEAIPPFRPTDVVAEYAATLKTYHCHSVSGDKYAGEWVASAFREQGISFEAAEKSKSELYLEFEPLMAQGMVELLENRRLFAQLRGLERKTRTGGRDVVDHYPGGHDDLANAVAGACVRARGGGVGPRIRSLGNDEPRRWPLGTRILLGEWSEIRSRMR